MTDIDRSNSLTDLAHRIKAEHLRGLQSNVACGRMLIEAKEQIKREHGHGHWVSWVRNQCGIPDRTARRYMQIAAYAINFKTANLADMGELTVEKAAEAKDWDLVGELMLDGPFTAQDTDNLEWFATKLLHQMDVPAHVALCCQGILDNWSDCPDESFGNP